jgi:hypothetical protein
MILLEVRVLQRLLSGDALGRIERQCLVQEVDSHRVGLACSDGVRERRGSAHECHYGDTHDAMLQVHDHDRPGETFSRTELPHDGPLT